MLVGDDVYDKVERLVKPDGGCVYLLGTSHCSHYSSQQAASLVRSVKPSSVALELCESRRHMLSTKVTAGYKSSMQTPNEEYSASSVLGSLSGLVADWTEVISLQYAAIDRLSEGGTACNEFRAAAVEAKQIDATVVLVDRDCNLTQRRLNLLVPTSELVWSILWEDRCWSRDQVSHTTR